MSILTGPKIPVMVGAGLGDPYLAQGNTMLRMLQALVQPNVISRLTVPPGSPANGDTYIIGIGATGVWTGHENDIAYWSTQNLGPPAWDYLPPLPGWRVYNATDGQQYEFDGVSWKVVGGVVFSTPGRGFFWGFQDVLPIADTSGVGAAVTSTDNEVGCAQLNLMATYVINKISCYCLTGSGIASILYAAIYSADGNTKLVEVPSGFDTGSTSVVLRTVTITPVTLTPGTYWFACGNAKGGSPGSVLGHGPYGSYYLNTLLNVNATRIGKAANPISGGAMPATLGAITAFTHADNSLSLPGVLFQP